jgi:hypothetical protein
VIIVEVLGYGSGDGTPTPPTPRNDDGNDDSQRRRQGPGNDRQSYNPDSGVRVLGYSGSAKKSQSSVTKSVPFSAANAGPADSDLGKQTGQFDCGLLL